MPKKLILLLASALILGGCGPQNTAQVPGSTQAPQAPAKNVFTSIADAITKQLLVKCFYTDKNGQTATTYIKGSSIRLSSSADAKQQVEGLIKDNVFYLWTPGKTDGLKISMADVFKDGSTDMDGTKITSVADIVSVLESHKDQCSLSPESDSLMVLPSDVKFSDIGGMFGGTGSSGK